MPERESVRAYIGLGANLGDPRAAIESAFAALAALPGTVLRARSSLYASAPVDASGPDYINAVAELDTALAPPALLAALRAIEAAAGRERPFPNAPRRLDLDLLAYGEASIRTPELTVPHPRLHRRAFVLLPLLELAPGLTLPGLGRVDRHLAATAGQRIERLGQ